MSSIAVCETVTVTLPPSECKFLSQSAERLLAGDPTAETLVNQLREAASLSNWLRDRVRLELSLVDAALLRELRHSASRADHALTGIA
jgi:hypothetical protein